MESKRKIINRYRSGEGIRSISRQLNISRNTIRAILRSNSKGALGASYVRSAQSHPVLNEHIKTLEKLLRENEKAKPKRTVLQLFEELQLHHYKGSYTTVSRYAAKFNRLLIGVNPSACVPLHFEPGEAYQFDWSTDEVIINDEVVSVKVAHFVLCHSRKKFTYIYPNETQEMVFDAHIRAFEFFGGTPVRGIYDNMKTAVDKVLRIKNERKWNPRFEHLCAHYMIEPTACTPARGNEKGRVERQVAIDRQQFFTPMPKAQSLQELNDILASQLIHYNSTHKHPEFKNKTIDEVFENERPYLVPAPVLFDGCKETNVRVSITCLVKYDRNSYSVDCSSVGQIVQCKAYADKLVFILDAKEVGRHERRFTTGQTYFKCWHYFPILARKPGALRNGAPFIDMDLPDELSQVRQSLEKHPNGMRDFAHILSYIPMESLESVVLACDRAIKAKTISKDVILNILFRKNDELPTTEEPIKCLKLEHTPQENCTGYNKLLSGVSL